VVLAGVADLRSAARGAKIVKEFDVGLVVVSPLFRSVILIVDGLNRAYGFASTTVNAFIRVDVEGTLTFVNAVNRAFFDTCLVLDIYTRLRDYVRHVPDLSTVCPGQ